MSVQNNSKFSSPVEQQTVPGQTNQEVINKVQLDKTLMAKLKIPDSRKKELQALWENNLQVLIPKQKQISGDNKAIRM